MSSVGWSDSSDICSPRAANKFCEGGAEGKSNQRGKMTMKRRRENYLTMLLMPSAFIWSTVL